MKVVQAPPYYRRPSAADDPYGATRRSVVFGIFGAVAVGLAAYSSRVAASVSAPALPASTGGIDSASEWQAFVSRFVSADGRVIDTGNGDISHSEGQGYGLVFAERLGDRAMFDRLLGWTERNLSRKGDHLHVWRFQPNALVAVDDTNNASDGDLLIAWALLRAGARWGDQGYTDLGTAIAADLLGSCVREVADATVLLPGAFGFEHPDRVIINPSYYVFPALTAVSAAVPHPRWQALQADGLRLLRRAQFGRWRLPPDWLEIAGNPLEGVRPAPDWPARFSWDAVRVPLNLAWAGLITEPAFTSAREFWASWPPGSIPAWADLTTDAVAPFPASCGVQAIASLTQAARAGAAPFLSLPHVADAEDYYSAALLLLARLVWQETLGRAAASQLPT